MEIDKYLHKHTEQEIHDLGVKGYYALRQTASEECDFDTLLDIAVYRFWHGSSVDVLEELFYLFGKTGYILGFHNFMKECSWAMFRIPQEVINRAQKLLPIGIKYPNLSDEELDFLEQLWCGSSSFEWMDIVMCDSDLLPRRLNRFDKSLLERYYNQWDDAFLLKVYDYFERNENLDDNYFCYDRKVNNIIRRNYEDVGHGEYVIDNSKDYKQLDDYLLQTYGEEVAEFFAQELLQMVGDNIEKFRRSTSISVRPEQIVSVAEDYFIDPEEIRNIKLWLAKDFLVRCNTPKK